MKPVLNLIGLAALALTTALPAWAEVTLTDLKGRTVTLPEIPDRVLLGFYYGVVAKPCLPRIHIANPCG